MKIRFAQIPDIPLILEFIRELAVYEKMLDQVIATERDLKQYLFSSRPVAEVLIVESDTRPVGFALFFHSFSTFLARPGIYLEDLYVKEAHRGRGYGKALLAQLAHIAIERGCARLEWSVLNWNAPSIEFYRALGSKVQTEWQTHRLTGDALQNLAQQGY